MSLQFTTSDYRYGLIWIGLMAGVGCGADGPPSPNARTSQNTPLERPDIPVPTGDQIVGEPPPLHVHPVAAQANNKKAGNEPHPFPQKIPIPDFSKDITWLNTKPLTKQDLKGKFVLLDFWTYCCINCMHILPELKKLEQAVSQRAGGDRRPLGQVRHARRTARTSPRPCCATRSSTRWSTTPTTRSGTRYGVNSWPTIAADRSRRAISLAATAASSRSTSVSRSSSSSALPYYREKKLLDETPLQVRPGSAQGARHAAAFSRQDAGRRGGRPAVHRRQQPQPHRDRHARRQAARHDRQRRHRPRRRRLPDGHVRPSAGMALHGETLYVADTENHLLRKVDLHGQDGRPRSPAPASKREHRLARAGRCPGAAHLPERCARPAARRPRSTAPGPCGFTGTTCTSPWPARTRSGRCRSTNRRSAPTPATAARTSSMARCLPQQPYQAGYQLVRPAQRPGVRRRLAVRGRQRRQLDPRRAVRSGRGSPDGRRLRSYWPVGRLFTFGDQMARSRRPSCSTAWAWSITTASSTSPTPTTTRSRSSTPRTAKPRRSPAPASRAPATAPPSSTSRPASTHAGKLYVADTNNHLIRTIDLATRQSRHAGDRRLDPPDTGRRRRPQVASAASRRRHEKA